MDPESVPMRGRARSAVTTRAYAGVHCKEAIEYFLAVMRDKKETTAQRSAAAKIILEYGAGKPAIMNVDGEDVKPGIDDDDRARLDALRAKYPELLRSNGQDA